jgi:murein tripeptide amidase MpaA
MHIHSNFDAGNIEVISITSQNVELIIPKDTNSDFLQWFYFKITDIELGSTQRVHITNAGDSAFPDGWENYRINVSYDNVNWFRIDTSYENGVLAFDIPTNQQELYVAYFEPFSYQQHLRLVQKASESSLCTIETLCNTPDGKPVELLVIGTPNAHTKKVWFIARQHPGETMAEWFIQGLVESLLDESNENSNALLATHSFYIIPNMNIDGSIVGNLRVNSLGINYNREWENPSIEKSPEVYYCLEKMDFVGVDFLMDVHGDEAIPYNFVTSLMGIPSLTTDTITKENRFKQHWMNLTNEFQDVHKYDNSLPGKANLSVCSKQIGERFGNMAYTLEMPFKDSDANPDLKHGWNGKRSMTLGASVLKALQLSSNEGVF